MKKATTQPKDFSKQQLRPTEQHPVRGGKQVLPSFAGSSGYVDWGEIDVRDDSKDGLVVSSTFGGNGG